MVLMVIFTLSVINFFEKDIRAPSQITESVHGTADPTEAEEKRHFPVRHTNV